MRIIRNVVVVLVLFVPAEISTAQIGPLWTFDERTAQADLVVIAKRVTTRDTGIRTSISEVAPPFPVVELLTEFQIGVVLKGASASDTLVMRHYRWDQERLGPGGVVNGPHALNFATNPGGAADYLLFLRRDADGLFVPVSGHVFPGESIFVLRSAR